MHNDRSSKNLPIRYKMLFSYSAVFIITIAISSTVIYSIVRNTIKSNIESELKNTSTTILNMVQTSISVSIKNHLRAVAEKNLEMVQHIYSLFQNGEMSEPEAKAMAKGLLLSQRIGTTGYIACVDSKGIMLIHPRKEHVGVDFSNRKFIQEMISRKRGYIEYKWRNPGELELRPKALFMSYFEPWDWIINASSYRNEFSSLVDIDDFEKSISALRFGKTGYAFIIDTKGTIISHPLLQGVNIFQENTLSDQPVKSMLAKKNGEIIYDWKNPGENVARKKLVNFKYLPDYEWIVATSSYLDEFYAPLDRVRNVIMLAVMASLAMVLPITFIISHSITSPLQKLVARLTQDGKDVPAELSKEPSGDEIERLTFYFDSFMDRLEVYSKNLHQEVAEVKRLQKEITNIGDKERQKIGHDLHDDLCPHLIGIEGLGTVMKRKLESRGIPEAKQMEKINDLLKEAVVKSRQFARGLCPVHLVDHGLVAALHEMADSVQSIFGIRCTFVGETDILIRDNTVATHIFRIIQEAVNNAVRHARATEILIRYKQKNGQFNFTVTDNGVGVYDEGEHTGMGLRIMAFRATMIQASLEIRKGENEGTTVLLEMRDSEKTILPVASENGNVMSFENEKTAG
jgi:signal transduction histidine kinase